MAEKETMLPANKHETGCLICGEALEYLTDPLPARCAICRAKKTTSVRCVRGHFVCDACHTEGLDTILSVCMEEKGTDPVAILNRMMSQPFCHMHGPEHHAMVGAALMTAYRNAGGDVDLTRALPEMIRRGKEVPGGVCGYWGACGAGISTGIFISIVTSASPLAEEGFGLANRMTAGALEAIGTVGGPRCCKRDSYLAVLHGIEFVREHLHVTMEKPERVVCNYSAKNEQCIGKRCPFTRSTPS